MKKWKMVTQKTIDQVQALKEAGVKKNSVIQKIVGYSAFPVICMAKSKTLEEYKGYMRKYTNKKKENAVQEQGEKMDDNKMSRIKSLVEQLMKEIVS